MQIKCLKCGEPGDFEMMRTVTPEDRDKLYSMDVFNYTCPKCGHRTYMEYDVAYHDSEKKEIVIFGGSSLIDELTEDYLVRVVFSPNELAEKAHILEQGRDDRIIEIMKILITAGIMGDSEVPDFRIVYDVYEGSEQFAAVRNDGSVMLLKWDEALYEELADTYRDKLPPMRNRDDLVVDTAWAVKALSM